MKQRTEATNQMRHRVGEQQSSVAGPDARSVEQQLCLGNSVKSQEMTPYFFPLAARFALPGFGSWGIERAF